jgi:hypothetical protein
VDKTGFDKATTHTVKIMFAHLKVASIAFLVIAAASQTARAQGSVTINLNVPVQLKDLDPQIARAQVSCVVQPVGGTTIVTFDPDNQRDGDLGKIVDGAFSGTVKVVRFGTSQQPLPPGQQWSYRCNSIFWTLTGVRLDPGSSGAPLVPTSGPNLVQGTFTTQ